MGGARSALTVTYPADPGSEAAALDARTLGETGGWRVSPPQRVEDQGSVFYESEITPAVTADAGRRPPLFPFLKTFGRYPEMALVFVGTPTGEGVPGEAANRYLTAEWTCSGGVTSYRVRIHDASFQRPEDVDLFRPAAAPRPASAAGRSTAALWGLLLLGALGAGIFAWGLTWWVMSAAEARRHAGEENEAGTANLPADAESDAPVGGPGASSDLASPEQPDPC